jgi:fatty-acyl-CoA synthase
MTRVPGAAGPTTPVLGGGGSVHPDRLEWDRVQGERATLIGPASAAGTGAVAAPATMLRCPTIGAALLEAAARDAGRVAYYLFDDADRQTRLSTAEVAAQAAAAAHEMHADGLRAGDRVIIALDTGPGLLAAFYGCALLGAVPVITEPGATARRAARWAERIGYIARITQARLLIVADCLAEQAVRAAQADGTCPVAGILQAVFPAGYDWTGPTPADPAQPAFIQFTSGTTAHPKGITISNGAVMANVAAMGAALRLCRSDLTVGWLPLHHDMGLVGLTVGPLLHELPAALLRPLGFLLRPERWLWAIHYLRGTVSAAPNFAYQLCATSLREEALTGLDLSSWRIACNGAEPVRAASIKRWQERMSPWGFRPEAMLPVYGMAEAALAVTMPTPGTLPVIDRISRSELASTGRAIPAADTADATDMVAVGQAIPGYRVRITDGSAVVSLPARQQGHILVGGPSLAGEYLGEPGDAAGAIADGWLHTGDLRHRPYQRADHQGRTQLSSARS